MHCENGSNMSLDGILTAQSSVTWEFCSTSGTNKPSRIILKWERVGAGGREWAVRENQKERERAKVRERGRTDLERKYHRRF